MKITLPLLLTATLITLPACAQKIMPSPSLTSENKITDRASVQKFIERMVSKHQFDRAELTATLDQLTPREKKSSHKTSNKKRKAKMDNPAESKPWAVYKGKHVKPGIIKNGVKFWNKHSALLQQAENKYGVPAHIIVGVLGVETRYGSYMGYDPVINSLATFAFDHRRSKFFSSELEAFLLMSREEKKDPFSYLGSYAGAMGMTQFMPSNYRKLAVDFDKDGVKDIWHNQADAIGSIANYFKHHKWKKGEAIATPISYQAPSVKTGEESSTQPYEELILKKLRPKHSVDKILKAGFSIDDQAVINDYPAKAKALLLELYGENGREFWLARHNFYVISKYNPRTMYTMAVFQLGEEILQAYKKQG
ncbi:MAG: lytic murein transglycosylase B [Thiotrichales bacterium]|jgi:membrane-bound lytic murein transglycosylase B|nr:lytic murein transglycosylase B [Thiotrichales bacterium]MBT3612747.1 lytic murein transglycosylase B [Thiotrichales bacterium]MBT3838123.1 lytic murein transglycosylase B [Thiotrichales bacterium]MBT4972138.1 lytic murein transglycosylase B [Thiotrichales bacterium]MBT5291069.1 lytic murein transglycosylase B [Thiotrichales bacterium]